MSNFDLLDAGFSAIFSEIGLFSETGLSSENGLPSDSILELIETSYDWSFCVSEEFMQSGGHGKVVNRSKFDPTYDFDFSKVKDDKKIYRRGGHRYYRPYGWNRIALKVRGKYDEGDEWLGPDGLRIEGAPNEWAVSYHGTKAEHVGNIIKEGFKPGPREKFGRGIYSSPSLKIVDERYAQEFSYGGKKYKIAIQTRVNPDRVKIIPATKTGVEAEYWISQEGDIRPYGVITKEIVASGCDIF